MKKKFLNLLVKVFRRIEDKVRREELNLFRKKYDIHETVRFNGKHLKLYGSGKIIIGENTYIGESAYLQSAEGCSIEIGANCAISHNVKIYTTSYLSDQDFNCGNERTRYSRDITIYDGVWIGVNVIILPGISIGQNSIIGSNSVVTKDVEENAIVGGIPAKLLRFKKID